MKHFTLFILLMGIGISLFSQESTTGIAFQKGEFKAILEKAKAEDKLVFMDVFTTWCGPCKMLDRNTFSDEEVGKKFNAQFVSYKLDAEKGEGIDIAAKYAVEAYPNMLFVNGNGELVHRVVGYIPAEELLKNAEVAAQKKANMKPISWYEANYAAKKGDKNFMEGYVTQLKMDGKDNSKQLEEYIGLLSPAEKSSQPAVDLVVENLQQLKGPAYEMLAQIAVNGLNNLKMKMLETAIQAKDSKVLAQLVQVIKETEGENAETQVATIELEYAKATGDTEMVRKKTEDKAISLLKLKDADLEKKNLEMYQKYKVQIDQELQGQDTTSAEVKQMMQMYKKLVSYNTANELNNLAWSYVEKMKDKADWSKALEWSARSLELNRDPSFLDTYANLLFRVGKQKEAIKIETEAVGKSEPDQKANYQATLDKMKKGQL
jgi:thioredoxin-related protein